jgi:processive 1,2-diacylglycerol beta-glucosyltransferase
VVATHHLPLVVLGRERTRGRLEAPLVGVVTDYTSHAHWAEEGVDAFCVGCPRARNELLVQGVARERIAMTGIPVRAAFERIPPAVTPAPGAPLRVLITSGGFGVGPVLRVVRSFLGVPRVELTVVCGSSESLAQKLREDESIRSLDLRILGFESNMPARLAEAHLVVGKAGGLTVTETLTAGRPMIVVGAVPGNEKCNEAFVVDGGAGYAADPRHVGRMAHLLRVRGEIGRLGAQARKLVLAGAAREVVAVAMDLAAPLSRRAAA